MSLITDALKKAQRERSAGSYALAHSHPASRPVYSPPIGAKLKARVWGNAALVALLAIGGLLYLRFQFGDHATASSTSIAPPPRAVASETPAPTVTFSSPVVPARVHPPSPFAPTANPALGENSENDYELAGMSSIGSRTLLSISRRSDRRSIWIPVGQTVHEITAVSYDPATDHAVIRVNGGAPITIALRDVGSPTSSATQPAE